jgi:hypothetical protein
MSSTSMDTTRPFRSAVFVSARRHLLVLRDVFLLLLLFVFAANAMEAIETKYFPGFTNIKQIGVPYVKDDMICAKLDMDKARAGSGVGYNVQVYIDKNPAPHFVGVLHEDHSLWGGPLSGSPTGHKQTTACAPIRSVPAWKESMRFRLAIDFELDSWRPYVLRTPPVWVYYEGAKPELAPVATPKDTSWISHR